MSILYITQPAEDTGLVAAITDEACPCGWPETILHFHTDARVTRGCASCEEETEVEPALESTDDR